VPGDVSSEEAVKGIVEETVRGLGRLDVMVANAGIGTPLVPIADVDLQVWKKIWSINVEGVVHCYKYAAAQMIKQGDGGRIIGASSVCGKKGFSQMGAYCASKFAVRGLTQCVALELAEHNITVNAYAPGIIDTPLLQKGGVQAAKEEMKIPHALTGNAEDIAHFVSYVASPQAQFMTGQTVNLDGGLQFD